MGKLWEFLTRDVRTLKWWGQNKPAPEADDLSPPVLKTPTESPEAQTPEIVSEVDPQKIEGLRFRREVLDWRDEFHFEVTETASQAKKMLAEQVEHELASMSFLRRLFAKPASETLEVNIESCVRSPMRRTRKRQEAALRKRLLTWLPHREDSAIVRVMWPKLEWDTRLALKFTTGNREQIQAVLRELILGENGLADRHRHWATDFAGHILEMRYGRSDSI